MFAQRQSLFREKEVMKTKLFAGAISMSLVCALGAACTVDNANAPVTRGHAGGAGGGTAGTQQGVDGAAGSGITAASTGGSNNGGMNAGGASGALGTGGAAGFTDAASKVSNLSKVWPSDKQQVTTTRLIRTISASIAAPFCAASLCHSATVIGTSAGPRL